MWFLVSLAAATNYYISIASGNDVECVDERGCNIDKAQKITFGREDCVWLRDPILSKSEFIQVMKSVHGSKMLTGMPTQVVEKEKSSTVSDHYLIEIKNREFSLEGLSFVNLHNPIFRVISGKLNCNECTIQGSRSIDAPIVSLIDSSGTFRAFSFQNNSLKRAHMLNITKSLVLFSSSIFDNNFYSGNSEWSFIHSSESNLTYENVCFGKTVVKHYSILARQKSIVNLKNVTFEAVKGLAVFALNEMSELRVNECSILGAECSIINAIDSLIDLNSTIIEREKTDFQAFSLKNSRFQFMNSIIKKTTVSLLFRASENEKVIFDNVSIANTTSHQGFGTFVKGEILLTNSRIDNFESRNGTSIWRVIDGSLTFNGAFLNRVNYQPCRVPLIWITNSVAVFIDSGISESSGSVLWSERSEYHITNSTFESVTCSASIDSPLPQGMIFSLNDKKSIVENSKFMNCSASTGVISSTTSSISVVECIFERCFGFRGTAIVCDHSTTSIRNCKFINNYAMSAGTIYGIDGVIDLDSCYFNGNKAAVTGNVVYIIGTTSLNLVNVSTGDNQTGLIASPVKYPRVSLKSCRVSDTMEEAFQTPKHRSKIEDSLFGCRWKCYPGFTPTSNRSRWTMTRFERLVLARDDLDACLSANGITFKSDSHNSHLARFPAKFRGDQIRVAIRRPYDHLVSSSAAKILIPKIGLVFALPPVFVIFLMLFLEHGNKSKIE